jgi:iron(III) transport system permease protein
LSSATNAQGFGWQHSPVAGLRQSFSNLSDLSRWAALIGGLAILTVLVVLPMAMLFYGSVRDEPPGLEGNFTLQNYAFLFTPAFGMLVLRSVVIGIGSTALALAIGAALGVIIVRTRVPFAEKLDALVIVPAYLPPFVGAIAWIVLLSPQVGYLNIALRSLGLPTFNIYSYGGIIWVMGLYYAPLAYLYLRPALLGIDKSLEESAMVMGASPSVSLRRIVLPLAMPAIVASCLVIFVNAIGDFGIPGVLGFREGIEVITTALVRLVVKFPSDPNTATVLGIMLMAVTMLGLAVNNRILAKRDYTTLGVRGRGLGQARTGRWRYLGLTVIVAYLVIALVLPLLAMAVTSFQKFPSPKLLSSNWTLDNYRFIFSFPAIQRSIVNSIVLSFGAAAFGTVLATVLGYFTVKHGGRLTKFVDYLAMSTIAVPHTVLGLGMIWFWVSVPIGIYGTKWILLFAYVAAFFPFSLRAAVSAFMQVDNSLEEAGRVFGASWGRTMWKIVVPMIIPALLSGATMMIYYSFRELTASLMLYTAGSEVIATAIWELYSEGRFVRLFALSMVNVVIVFALVALANRLSRVGGQHGQP